MTSDVALTDADINALTDRAAMGLPESYEVPAAERLPIADVLGDGPEALLGALDAAAGPVQTRLAAGTMLALLGDPRVRPGGHPVMVDVPGGRFPMGTADDDVDELHADTERFGVRRDWIAKECPRAEAVVRPFRIAAYPVTNAEYAAFLADTAYPELPTHWGYGRYHPAEANHPVYTVTPRAADAYTGWLTRRTGRAYRLPAETEWEYAAAGPDGLRYPWGPRWLPDLANTLECRLMASSPVGVFPGGRSWCGAYDLAGNVEEYTSSHYFPYPGGRLVEDDLYRRLGHYRIARGGAFNRFRDLARCQRRHGPYPRSLYAMGFRVAADV
ncbi:SUMF1/EgtB/PvdO family nonheme iron enzyme [Dactylosporangium sp. NPDC005555]|uniref:formylglycine-generating enzyme family protein n=1 Tax=Dactylosporangium sp. NPDC005555 TaxID=3154889 RepID=UPI0033ADFB74